MTFLAWCHVRADRARKPDGGGYENDPVALFCLDWIIDNDRPRGWISELTFERYVAEYCPEERQSARRAWRQYQDEKKRDQWSETAPSLS